MGDLSSPDMLVQLYVYDLSNGMARAISAALLGTQIDAVYHTSIVMDGIEYVYDGGLKTIDPGGSHLGRPIQVIDLGTTNLPLDVIMEYLESLREVYTEEVGLFVCPATGLEDDVNMLRRTIFGPITATTSRMISQHSYSGRVFHPT